MVLQPEGIINMFPRSMDCFC